MVQNRTHFNKTAKEIEEAIEQAKNDPNNLKSLVEEINFRKKSRKKLEPSLIKANEYLRSKSEEEKLADISPRPEKPQTPIRHSKANHKLTETEDIGCQSQSNKGPNMRGKKGPLRLVFCGALAGVLVI